MHTTRSEGSASVAFRETGLALVDRFRSVSWLKKNLWRTA